MENFEYSPEIIRELQLTELQMLKAFDRICRKYNIKYIILKGGHKYVRENKRKSSGSCNGSCNGNDCVANRCDRGKCCSDKQSIRDKR